MPPATCIVSLSGRETPTDQIYRTTQSVVCAMMHPSMVPPWYVCPYLLINTNKTNLLCISNLRNLIQEQLHVHIFTTDETKITTNERLTDLLTEIAGFYP